MASEVYYTARTRTTGGRNGAAQSSDGQLDVKLALPGSNRPGTNPEQLFAAGWSACFLGVIGKAALEHAVRLPADAAIDAEVDLVVNETGGYSLEARLDVSLPGLDQEIAEALAARAHQLCPYSKATRGNVPVAITVADHRPAAAVHELEQND
jgi:Ohr subfamily peroxiredoxin